MTYCDVGNNFDCTVDCTYNEFFYNEVQEVIKIHT